MTSSNKDTRLDWVLDAGHVYTPLKWQVGLGYQRDDSRCCHAVHDGRVGFHQCGRKPKVERDVVWHGKAVRLGYCGTHDPVAVKTKREAIDAKWMAERDAMTARYAEERRMKELSGAAIDAIKAIAAGHNDARSLALELLERYGELAPPPSVSEEKES